MLVDAMQANANSVETFFSLITSFIWKENLYSDSFRLVFSPSIAQIKR